MKCIERVQRKASHIVSLHFDYVNVTTDHVLKDLNWMSLENRRKMSRLSTLYKCKAGYPGLQELQEKLQEPHYHSSRLDHQFKIRPIHATTNQFKFSFLPRTIQDWNSLPAHILSDDRTQRLNSLPVFQHRLSDYYLTEQQNHHT